MIYKDSQRNVTPSTRGHYVSCEYFILVEPLFGGCFSQVEDKSFKVNLTILQPAIHQDPIEKPENWRPSIAEDATFYLNLDPNTSN